MAQAAGGPAFVDRLSRTRVVPDPAPGGPTRPGVPGGDPLDDRR